ncbi:hypothetical protein [Acidovorax sp. LjRoot118]
MLHMRCQRFSSAAIRRLYAVIGFVQLPVSLLGMVAPWIGVPELTLVLSVLALKRYGRVLVVALLGAQDPR